MRGPQQPTRRALRARRRWPLAEHLRHSRAYRRQAHARRLWIILERARLRRALTWQRQSGGSTSRIRWLEIALMLLHDELVRLEDELGIADHASAAD